MMRLSFCMGGGISLQTWPLLDCRARHLQCSNCKSEGWASDSWFQRFSFGISSTVIALPPSPVTNAPNLWVEVLLHSVGYVPNCLVVSHPTGSVVLKAEGNRPYGERSRCVFLGQTDLRSWWATAVKFRVAVVSWSQVRVENLLEMQEGKQHPDLSEVILAPEGVTDCRFAFCWRILYLCLEDTKGAGTLCGETAVSC